MDALSLFLFRSHLTKVSRPPFFLFIGRGLQDEVPLGRASGRAQPLQLSSELRPA